MSEISTVKRIGWLLLGSLVLLCQPVLAEVYKYEDRAGNLYFTDRPMRGGNYKLLWRSGPDRKPRTSARMDASKMAQNRERFTPMIMVVARRTNMKAELLHAVIRAESAYDPKAVSRTGAIGLMQLMPETAKRYGVKDSWDPESNVDGGARYLSDLLKMFDNDLRLALAGYNAGENAVIKYGRKIPPYPETQNYVTKVLSFYRDNRAAAQDYPTIR
ncbi:MAG: lytic transglycosylase domain-containing protein [Candidatus Sedimenticola sp. 4PFRAG1]